MDLVQPAGVSSHYLANVIPAFFYDANLQDGCIFNSELGKNLFNLKPSPRASGCIDLYVTKTPMKISLRMNQSLQTISRECSIIGILPAQYHIEADIWIPFKGNESIWPQCIYAFKTEMADFQPVYDQSISFNLFRARRRFFETFYGPGSTLHVAIKLLKEPSRLALLSFAETESMFDTVMNHRRGLTKDNMATVISAVTYLIWGLPISKTPSDCQLDSLGLLELFEHLLNTEAWDDFMFLSSNAALWSILDITAVVSLKKTVGRWLHKNFKFATFTIENLFTGDQSFSQKDILNSILNLLNNHIHLGCNLACMYYLVDKYAEVVGRSNIEEDRPEIKKILRNVFILPSRCECKTCRGCCRNTCLMVFRHIRWHWDFAFSEEQTSCTDEIVCKNTNDVKHWIIEMLDLEKVLTLKLPAEDFFSSILAWLPSVKNIRADLFLLAIEFYLSLSNFSDVVLLNPKDVVDPVISWLLNLVDKLLANKTYFDVDGKTQRVKGACILSDLHYHHLFSIYLKTINALNFVPTRMVKSMIQFSAIVLKNDYSCFVHLLNEFSFNAEDIVSVSKLLVSDEDKLVLMVFHETMRSFESTEVNVEDNFTTLRWHVPKTIIELGADDIEVVFWSFRFFLLHYIGMPLDSSKLYMDVDGAEGIDLNEFAMILNFVIERYFELNRILEKVIIEVVYPYPIESLSPADNDSDY